MYAFSQASQAHITNLLAHKRVGVALQATVETLYGKWTNYYSSGNYKDLDKTRVKLFPNFTRHHLITY